MSFLGAHDADDAAFGYAHAPIDYAFAIFADYFAG